MSEKPLTPAERISLVDNDRARKYGQIAIAIFLIAFAVGFLIWFVMVKADAAFLGYMATGILALVFAGIGAAFAIFGLGRTVGSSNNSNNDQILLMLQTMMAGGPGNADYKKILDELPDIENPGEAEEINTLHEEIPEEVPPERPA